MTSKKKDVRPLRVPNDPLEEIIQEIRTLRGGIVTEYTRKLGEIVDFVPELEHQTAIAMLERDYEEWEPSKHPNATILIIDPDPEESSRMSDIVERLSVQNFVVEQISFEREESEDYSCYAILYDRP